MKSSKEAVQWMLVVVTAPTAAVGLERAIEGQWLVAMICFALCLKCFFAYIKMPPIFFSRPQNVSYEELVQMVMRYRAELDEKLPLLKWADQFCGYFILFGVILLIAMLV